MHILVITPGFPKDEFDTSCIPPMQELLKALKTNSSDFKISVISLYYPYKKNIYNWNDISVFSCGGKNNSKPSKIFTWLLALYFSIKINRKNNVNIIHSFWLTDSALLGSMLSRIFDVKHISTMMGQDAKSENKFLRRLNLDKIIKISVSNYQAEIFKKSSNMYQEKIIPWGIKPLYINKIERQIDVLGVGALIPIKNYCLFVKVISKLKNKFPDIKAVLIGDGIQRIELEELILKYNLKENLYLAGHLNREKVISYMLRSKIFLHTSDYESFGYVLAEAEASGCKIVCRSVGCAMGNDNFFIAEGEDDFCEIISRLLLSKLEFKSLSLFPLEVTVNSYVDVYRKYSNGNETSEV